MNIDSIEKQKIKLYTVSAYTEGMYLTYQSFKNQQPNNQITAEIKNGSISKVKTVDSTGRSIKVKPGNVYAIVYQGQPFVATGSFIPGFFDSSIDFHSCRSPDLQYRCFLSHAFRDPDHVLPLPVDDLSGNLFILSSKSSFQTDRDHILFNLSYTRGYRRSIDQ